MPTKIEVLFYREDGSLADRWMPVTRKETALGPMVLDRAAWKHANTYKWRDMLTGFESREYHPTLDDMYHFVDQLSMYRKLQSPSWQRAEARRIEKEERQYLAKVERQERADAKRRARSDHMMSNLRAGLPLRHNLK